MLVHISTNVTYILIKKRGGNHHPVTKFIDLIKSIILTMVTLVCSTYQVRLVYLY